MDAERDADLITKKITIEAPASEVFSYFTDPDKMTLWHARAAWMEARAGGEFRIDVNGRSVARGSFVAVEPPHRVVFTRGWEGSADMPPGSTTVEVTLRDLGGKTELTLVHRGIPASERPPNAAGWDHYLPRLQATIERGDAGVDPWAAGGA